MKGKFVRSGLLLLLVVAGVMLLGVRRSGAGWLAAFSGPDDLAAHEGRESAGRTKEERADELELKARKIAADLLTKGEGNVSGRVERSRIDDEFEKSGVTAREVIRAILASKRPEKKAGALDDAMHWLAGQEGLAAAYDVMATLPEGIPKGGLAGSLSYDRVRYDPEQTLVMLRDHGAWFPDEEGRRRSLQSVLENLADDQEPAAWQALALFDGGDRRYLLKYAMVTYAPYAGYAEHLKVYLAEVRGSEGDGREDREWNDFALSYVGLVLQGKPGTDATRLLEEAALADGQLVPLLQAMKPAEEDRAGWREWMAGRLGDEGRAKVEAAWR